MIIAFVSIHILTGWKVHEKAIKETSASTWTKIKKAATTEKGKPVNGDKNKD
jgi:hypothetical protein